MAVGIGSFTVEAGRKHARIHDRHRPGMMWSKVGISHFLGYRINDQEFRRHHVVQWGLAGNQFSGSSKSKSFAYSFLSSFKMFSAFIIAR